MCVRCGISPRKRSGRGQEGPGTCGAISSLRNYSRIDRFLSASDFLTLHVGFEISVLGDVSWTFPIFSCFLFFVVAQRLSEDVFESLSQCQKLISSSINLWSSIAPYGCKNFGARWVGCTELRQKSAILNAIYRCLLFRSFYFCFTTLPVFLFLLSLDAVNLCAWTCCGHPQSCFLDPGTNPDFAVENLWGRIFMSRLFLKKILRLHKVHDESSVNLSPE